MESAHQSLVETGSDLMRTFQSEEQFFAVFQPQVGAWVFGIGDCRIADEATSQLEQKTPLSKVVETMLVRCPRASSALFYLQVIGGTRGTGRVRCPALFIAAVVSWSCSPSSRKKAHGRLIRQCGFPYKTRPSRHGERGYIRGEGMERSWGWRDIATSVPALDGNSCDAEQLLGALIRRMKRSLRGKPPETLTSSPCSSGHCARPWCGVGLRPVPLSPSRTFGKGMEEAMLEKLMDEPGARIICGDTTAEIAAGCWG